MEINGQVSDGIKVFSRMGLPPALIEALEKRGVFRPTPVQSGAIPYFLDWRDVIAKAPTGTGKTFAFGLPMLAHIDPADKGAQGLILAPTRELALQIEGELRGLCAALPDIHLCCLYGGAPMEKQVKALRARPQIIVATPGRLLDHLKRKNLSLSGVHTVVLDEADRMLDMGFIDSVIKILDKTTARRSLGMFSATLSIEVMDISWVYQRDPVEITVPPLAESKPDIMQYRIALEARDKMNLTARLIEAGGYQRCILFCNTKLMSDRLCEALRLSGFSAGCIHGDIRQAKREQVLNRFRTGRLPILVATDVAARGLDIDDVDAVINYDIPEENEHYIHRIGRTGRAGREGVSYTLVSGIPEQVRMNEIERATKNQITRLSYENGVLLDQTEENEG